MLWYVANGFHGFTNQSTRGTLSFPVVELADMALAPIGRPPAMDT
jgi:hypothetical protein